MASDDYQANLARISAAALHSVVVLLIAKEMFGKGLFALGVGEREIVEQAAFQLIGGYHQGLSPEKLQAGAPGRPMGFQTGSAATPDGPGPQKPDR